MADKLALDFAAIQSNLKSPDWKVRVEAAHLLGMKKHGPSVELLIDRLLHDKSQTVRSRAAVALGRIKDPRAIGPLLEAGDACVKHATNQLPKFGNDVVPVLAARLADKSLPASSRSGMVSLLTETGGEAAQNVVIAAAWDESETVRFFVAESLGRFKSSSKTLTEELFSALLFLLRDPVPMVGSAAAKSLGTMRDERAIEILVHMFHGDQPFQQDFDLFNGITNVLRAWAGVRGKTFEEVMPLLQHQEPLPRIAAALSLVWLRDERGVRPLEETTNDQDELVRYAATWSLTSLQNTLSQGVDMPPNVSNYLLR